MSEKTPDLFNVEDEILVVSIAANPIDKDHSLVFKFGEQAATLTAQASLDLLQWLYERQDMFYRLAHDLPDPSDVTQRLPRITAFKENLPGVRSSTGALAARKKGDDMDVSLADMLPDDLNDKFYQRREE